MAAATLPTRPSAPAVSPKAGPTRRLQRRPENAPCAFCGKSGDGAAWTHGSAPC
jgi:hypothetical protein